jgi:uncharacterized protein (DUF1501 family)
MVRLLGGSALTAAIGGVPFSLAHAATDKRLVVVVLRGALDGLAAVPPYADPAYREVRGNLALPAPGAPEGALDLDGRFGLHPALRPLDEWYRARELLVVHAVATPYRSRSHFDGQDLLENGGTRVRGVQDGWLNRALTLLERGDARRSRLGLAVGQTVPLMLRGQTPVSSWAPPDMPELHGEFLARVARMYRADPVLGPAINEGIRAQAMTGEVIGSDRQAQMDPAANRGPRNIARAADAVGRLLASAQGPRVAVLELGGWDTHAGQGVINGRLANQLRNLAEGLAALRAALGAAWSNAAVAVVTEFGRTVAPNGTGGTDHGTGTVAFLLGGRINGGRVVTQWPGLAQNRLFEGRDLTPTADLRSVMKPLLARHLGLAQDAVDRVVFPDSASAAPLPDLIRA